MTEILKCPNRNQKKSDAFYVGVPLLSFLLELLSTLLTLHCLKCLFHVNIHINKVRNVMFVENVSIWNVTSENISKKRILLFLVLSWSCQYFWQHLPNQKVQVMASFYNNHYWSYTFLNPWALWIFVIQTFAICLNISRLMPFSYVTVWTTLKWFIRKSYMKSGCFLMQECLRQIDIVCQGNTPSQ